MDPVLYALAYACFLVSSIYTYSMPKMPHKRNAIPVGETGPDLWLRVPSGIKPLIIDSPIIVEVDGGLHDGFTIGSLKRALAIHNERLEDLPDESQIIFSHERPPTVHHYYDGRIVIDRKSSTLKLNGAVIEMAAREFNLLAFLGVNPDEVFSPEEILKKLWHENYSESGTAEATVRTHIRRIREKLSQNGLPGKEIISSVRGFGYQFVSDLELPG